jgi:hypothetical protein
MAAVRTFCLSAPAPRERRDRERVQVSRIPEPFTQIYDVAEAVRCTEVPVTRPPSLNLVT